MATGFNVIRQDTKRAFRRSFFALAAAMKRPVLYGAVCISVSSCGVYSAEEITATVVDADTKAPIEGVNVVADWAVRGGINYGRTVGYINVMETTTGKDGKFYFPRWGPRPNFHFGAIRLEAPGLTLFKGGYKYLALENNGNALVDAPPMTRSDWNHQVISLTQFNGPPQAYKASFNSLMSDVDNLRREGRWPDIPRFLCALGRESAALAARGVADALYPLEHLATEGVDCSQSRGPQ